MMVALALIPLFFLSTFLLASAHEPLEYGAVFSVTVNCSANTLPCGPTPSCCAPGLKCNYRRGIPICVNTGENYVSGFDRDPCADPYLFRCDEVVGIGGFCCPIGTACFTHGSNNVVECVDALGTTASAFPSATTGLIPSATPILSSDVAIVYDPPQAWNVSSTEVNCTTSKSWHSTDSINATVSYNYTGPSIMVHTGTSSIGGAFWVLADGFNTTSTIDTYSGPGNLTPPVCYPVQFPPFAVTPPGYESRKNHTLTLVFSGPSSDAPDGTNGSNFQFNGFAIPDLQFTLGATNDASSEKRQFYLCLTHFVLFSIFFLM